jgi:hypothetical protein
MVNFAKQKNRLLVFFQSKLDILLSIFYQLYYSRKKPENVNSDKREYQIIISFTSFPIRFNTLYLCIKTLLNQTLKPDLILLVLSKEETPSLSDIPSSILNLRQYGLKILLVDDNLKPHNKYFYAMLNYPKSIIITVDDDCYYDQNLIKSLFESFQRYPHAISARRVHKILTNNNRVCPYNNWINEYKKSVIPCFDTIATGCGGVLYPPGILPPETFDISTIKNLCLNADDIWLKFIELKNKIPVVWVKTNRIHAIGIRNTQKVSLGKSNVAGCDNDTYIANLQNYFGIDLALLRNNQC